MRNTVQDNALTSMCGVQSNSVSTVQRSDRSLGTGIDESGKGGQSPSKLRLPFWNWDKPQQRTFHPKSSLLTMWNNTTNQSSEPEVVALQGSRSKSLTTTKSQFPSRLSMSQGDGQRFIKYKSQSISSGGSTSMAMMHSGTTERMEPPPDIMPIHMNNMLAKQVNLLGTSSTSQRINLAGNQLPDPSLLPPGNSTGHHILVEDDFALGSEHMSSSTTRQHESSRTVTNSMHGIAEACSLRDGVHAGAAAAHDDVNESFQHPWGQGLGFTSEQTRRSGENQGKQRYAQRTTLAADRADAASVWPDEIFAAHHATACLCSSQMSEPLQEQSNALDLGLIVGTSSISQREPQMPSLLRHGTNDVDVCPQAKLRPLNTRRCSSSSALGDLRYASHHDKTAFDKGHSHSLNTAVPIASATAEGTVPLEERPSTLFKRVQSIASLMIARESGKGEDLNKLVAPRFTRGRGAAHAVKVALGLGRGQPGMSKLDSSSLQGPAIGTRPRTGAQQHMLSLKVICGAGTVCVYHCGGCEEDCRNGTGVRHPAPTCHADFCGQCNCLDARNLDEMCGVYCRTSNY